MIKKSLIDKIKHIKFWSQGGVRAPHKPLLILYAIGRINDRYIPYNEIEVDFSNLLDRFGVQLSKNRAQYPFWRLQNDSIWEIPNSDLYIENKYVHLLLLIITSGKIHSTPKSSNFPARFARQFPLYFYFLYY